MNKEKQRRGRSECVACIIITIIIILGHSFIIFYTHVLLCHIFQRGSIGVGRSIDFM